MFSYGLLIFFQLKEEKSKMEYYYISKKPLYTGEYEIHKSSCYRLPSEGNRILLGYLGSGNDAIGKAREMFGKVNACFNCCNEYHKSQHHLAETE
jgi:hypothetical protein